MRGAMGSMFVSMDGVTKALKKWQPQFRNNAIATLKNAHESCM
jgi:hypothetical protein